MELFAFIEHTLLAKIALVLLSGIVTLSIVPFLTEIASLCSSRVGLVEQLWSLHRNMREGRMMALPGKTGDQMTVLRGGVSFVLCRWLYRAAGLQFVPVREGKVRPGFDTTPADYFPARSSTQTWPLPAVQITRWSRTSVAPCGTSFERQMRAWRRGSSIFRMNFSSA